MKVSVHKVQNFVIFSLLFLAAMNFSAKFFYFVFGAFCALILFRRKIVLLPNTLVYLLLSFLTAAYHSSETILSMLRCMAWLLFYLVGLNLAGVRNSRVDKRLEYDSGYSEKNCYKILVVIACGSFGHYLLNFLYNFHNILNRNTNDIWSGTVMAATGQAALACIMSGLAVAWLFAPPKKKYRVLGILCVVTLFVYNQILACRTPLVIFAVLLIVGFLFMVRTAKTGHRKARLIAGFGTVVALVVVAISLNLFGIRDSFMDSNLFGRFDGTGLDWGESDRFDAKFMYLQNAHENLFGGLHLREKYGYAHDLWLDGYDEYGIFGLILLVVITIIGIKDLVKLVRRTNYSKAFKLTITCIYIAILLQFCVEPILAGMAWLFACYCLINGCIAGMNMAYKKTVGGPYENTSSQHRIR